MKKKLNIASRKSALALWQSRFVQRQLMALYPDLDVSILGVETTGDRLLETPLSKIGGKGLFVKALEEMLLSGEADIAVHSLKDMPAYLPAGLEISAILEREDPRDAFISNQYHSLSEVPTGAPIGTSSLRRQSQLYAHYPTLTLQAIRGNVDTRLEKLDQHQCAGLILAVAGLKRLGLESRIHTPLSPGFMLPAVGQGAICIEGRAQDAHIQALLAPLHHLPTARCVLAERALNAALEGGCEFPIAGYATVQSNGDLHLEGLVGSLDGQKLLKASATGAPEAFISLGQTVAKKLLAQGAGALLGNGGEPSPRERL